MLLQMLECSIGNQITQVSGFAFGDYSGINTRWGDVVESNYVNDSTLHIDLDLQRTIEGPNPEVDVDFDLVFRCEAGQVKTIVKNLTSNTNWVGSLQNLVRTHLFEAIGAAVGAYLGDAKTGEEYGGKVDNVTSELLSFGYDATVGVDGLPGSCRNIKVLPSKNIQIN